MSYESTTRLRTHIHGWLVLRKLFGARLGFRTALTPNTLRNWKLIPCLVTLFSLEASLSPIVDHYPDPGFAILGLNETDDEAAPSLAHTTITFGSSLRPSPRYLQLHAYCFCLCFLWIGSSSSQARDSQLSSRHTEIGSCTALTAPL